jgi:hypothetical protein
MTTTLKQIYQQNHSPRPSELLFSFYRRPHCDFLRPNLLEARLYGGAFAVFEKIKIGMTGKKMFSSATV